MILLCESNLFPHDRDYDGTDADHLPVIPGHDLTSHSKPKADGNQIQRPALTDPIKEAPAEQPPGRVFPPKNIMPILIATEAKPSTGVVQGGA
jgi:hypothetical protein